MEEGREGTLAVGRAPRWKLQTRACGSFHRDRSVVGTSRLVVSVAGASARQLLRDALRELGFEELRDYVCAA